MSEDMKLDDLVTTYLTIRTERNTLKNQWEIRDAELKADLEQLEQAMLVACNARKLFNASSASSLDLYFYLVYRLGLHLNQ